MTYLLLKKYADTATALVAAALLGISSYAVWAGNAGYLEGVEILFILLSIYFVFPWLDGQSRTRYLWPVFAVLSILSKYTSLFLLPAGAVSLFLAKGRKFFEKGIIKRAVEFFIIAILLLSPLIIYNVQVFRTRGHFDSALSSIVGISSHDFYIVEDRRVSSNIISNAKNVGETLIENNSLTYLFLFLSGLVFLTVKALKKKNSLFENVILIHFGFLMLMFLLSGAIADRTLSIITIFMAMITAIFIIKAYKLIQSKNKSIARVFVAVSILFVMCELAYSINTNILQKPIGPAPFMFSASRLYDLGWNDAERYIKEKIFTNSGPRTSIQSIADVTNVNGDNVNGRNILFFDERLNWFSISWYIYKYLIYYDLPLFGISDLGKREENMDFLSFLASHGSKNIYFLYGADESVLDSIKKQGQIAESTEVYREALDKAMIPFEEIHSSDGGITFKIYKLK